MATIQTVIKLQDRITSTLNNIQGALGRTANAFGKLGNASADCVNTRSIEVARNKIERLKTSLLSNNNQIANAQSRINQLEAKNATELVRQQQLQKRILSGKTNSEVATHRLHELETKIAANKVKIANEQRTINHLKTQAIAKNQKIANLENQIEKEINENTAAQRRFNASLFGGGKGIGALLGKLKTIGYTIMGTTALIGLGNVAVKTADNLAMTRARLNLMNDGLQTTDQLQQKIYQSAMRSRAGYLETADAVAKLRLRAGQIFKTNDEAIAFSETLNKMFTVAGTSVTEMHSATLQLTQALGSGVLRGEEFRAVFEAAPNVMEAVADYMNLPIGKLREIANEGMITADIVKNAMFKAAKKVDAQFKNIPITWMQVWTMVKNFTIKSFEPILKKITQITSSKRFVGFMNGVGNAIQRVAQIMGAAFDVVLKVSALIYDKWDVITSVLSAVAIVWIPKMIAGLWAALVPVVLQLGAWLIMNWPILLVIATITALIMVCRHFGVTFAEVCGFVCGSALWLYEGLKNIFKWIYDVVVVTFMMVGITVANVFIWIGNMVYGVCSWVANAWQWCGDNIATVFHNIGVWWDNLWIDAKIGFYSFINDVLSKLSWLAGKIQPIADLLDIDLSGMIGNAQASVSGKISGLEASKRQYKEYTSFKGADWSHFDYLGYAENIEPLRPEYGDLGDAYDKGNAWGQNLINGLADSWSGTGIVSDDEKMMSFPGSDFGGLNDLGKALTGGFGNDNPLLDNIADNTAAIANNTSDSDEDLSYMRDLAEREAINRYTLTDLKVEMTNNNNVSSQLDINDLLKQIQKQVYESVLSTAEGVHY